MDSEPNVDRKIGDGNNLAATEELENDASEKLVASESKTPLKTPVNDVEVKFIAKDSANGDAKIDIENVRVAFAGMAKEELMKYANDPFWVRMRFFLFIFFWILWFAMFIGAIAIIVVAPRCEAPEPRKWYQESPLYEVKLKSFIEPSTSETLLDGLKSKLSYFSDLNIKGIILSPIFMTSDGSEENVIDFMTIDNEVGNLDSFKSLVDAAKSLGIHIILTLVPNHSSKAHHWFQRSVTREDPYTDYYVWTPRPGGGDVSGIPPNSSEGVPNNWRSVYGTSAWEWDEDRKEFYLHQFNANQPDLNFHNNAVKEEFEKIIQFWLELGVSGFQVEKAQFLLEDSDLNDELPGNKPGYVHVQYDFYYHSRTYNLPEVANILSNWRKIVHSQTQDDGILIMTGEEPSPENKNETTVVVDLSYNKQYLSSLKPAFTADNLLHPINEVISNRSWHGVQFGNDQVGRVATLLGDEAVDGLNIVTLLLPGTPVTFYGEELGLKGDPNERFPWYNSSGEGSMEYQKEEKESHYKIYKSLIDARASQSVLYGETAVQVVNGSVLAYTRMKSGNPGYLVVYNPTPENVTTTFESFSHLPEELTVLIRSSNFGLGNVIVKTKLQTNEVTLTPKSALVLTFVPKNE